MNQTQLFQASLDAVRAGAQGWRLEASGQALPAWQQPRQNQTMEWEDDDFTYVLQQASEAGGAAAAMAAAIAAERERWAALPVFAHATWLVDWGSEPSEVTSGWVGGRSLLDAWSMREEPEWRIPQLPRDLGPEETAFLLERDDVHGTGSFTLARLQGDGRVRLDYSDGHRFFPLTIEPLDYWELALESFGWFGWQLLFASTGDSPEALRQRYVQSYAPMLVQLAELVPGGAERPRLRAAVEAWVEREGVER